MGQWLDDGLNLIAGVGSWTYDGATGMATMDAAAAAIYGLPVQDGGWRGSANEALEAVPPEDRPLSGQLNGNTTPLADGTFYSVSAPFRVVREGEPPRWVRVHARTNTEQQRSWGYLVDVTELVMARARVKELEPLAYRARRMDVSSRLASPIAHDMANMLVPVTMAIEILGLSLPEDHPDHVIVSDAVAAAHAVAALGRQLVGVVRETPTFVDRDLASIAEGVARLLTRSLPPGVSLSVHTQPSVARVQISEGAFLQIVTNLVFNAADAVAEKGGRVELAVTDDGAELTLSVDDDGPGFPPEVLTKLEEGFFTTKPHGTGLGLIMSRSLSAEAGARLMIGRSSLGGARVSVTFPVATRNSSLREMMRVEGKGRTVFVLEGDEGITHVLSRALELAGFRVLRAPSATRWETIRRHDPEPVTLILASAVVGEEPAFKTTLHDGFGGDPPVLWVGPDAPPIEGPRVRWLRTPFVLAELYDAVARFLAAG